MASLRRKPNSRYWIACYTTSDGEQKQRSTKLTDRTKAQRVADGYEAIYREKQTEGQVRRAMTEIFDEIHGGKLAHMDLDRWFDTWLERRKPEVSPNTYDRYNDMVKLVRRMDAEATAEAKNAGTRYQPLCATGLDRLEPKPITEIRNRILLIRSQSSTNDAIKLLKMCLKAAWMEGLISDNPAARVAKVRVERKDDSEEKRPFTVSELRAVLKLSDDEWRGMILAGLYSAGQRLSDITTLQVGQIDLKEHIVKFRSTDKTGRVVIVPIVPAWMTDLKRRVKGKPPEHRLFPTAYRRFKEAHDKTNRTSNAFRRLLARAGLATHPSQKREGAIEGRRKINPLSFHSLRHTATSMMKNAGVSDSVVMDIVGHDSEAVSQSYTHIDEVTKRAALEKLPDIT